MECLEDDPYDPFLLKTLPLFKGTFIQFSQGTSSNPLGIPPNVISYNALITACETPGVHGDDFFLVL